MTGKMNIGMVTYGGFGNVGNYALVHSQVQLITNIREYGPKNEYSVLNLSDPFLFNAGGMPHIPNQKELEQRLFQYVEEYNIECLLVTGWVNEYVPLLRALASLKEYTSRKVKIVLGGPHPTWFPEATFKNMEDILNTADKEYKVKPDQVIDVLVQGEGEYALEALYKFISGQGDRKDISGAYWMEEDNVVQSKISKEVIKNLDSIRLPDWDLLQNFDHHWPFMSVDINRACKHACRMCAHSIMSGHHERFRDTDLVAQYLVKINERTGITQYRNSGAELDVHFAERLSKSFIKYEIKERGIRIRSFARVGTRKSGTYIDKFSPEVMKMMYEAGFVSHFIGMESSNQSILDKLNKGTTLELINEHLKIAKDTGIDIYASIMLGGPGETKDTIKTTRDYILGLHQESLLKSVPVVPFVPLPGSVFGDKPKLAKKMGYELNPNWKQIVFNFEALLLNPHLQRNPANLYTLRESGLTFGDLMRITGEIITANHNAGLPNASDEIGGINDVLKADLLTTAQKYRTRAEEGMSTEDICHEINHAWNIIGNN